MQWSLMMTQLAQLLFSKWLIQNRLTGSQNRSRLPLRDAQKQSGFTERCHVPTRWEAFLGRLDLTFCEFASRGELCNRAYLNHWMIWQDDAGWPVCWRSNYRHQYLEDNVWAVLGCALQKKHRLRHGTVFSFSSKIRIGVLCFAGRTMIENRLQRFGRKILLTRSPLGFLFCLEYNVLRQRLSSLMRTISQIR